MSNQAPIRREERLAENETRFRDINERLERDLLRALLPPTRVQGFICECSRTDCVELVELSLTEYASVRENPRRFAVRHGHGDDLVEELVQRLHGYDVVEKRAGRPAEIAERAA